VEKGGVRILHVGKYYAPVTGGMETLVRGMAEGEAAAGDEVTVLCASSSVRGDEEWIEGVHVIRSPRLGEWHSQPVTPGLPLQLARLAREHDVVHVHAPNPLAESAALALPAGIPLVVSHHSDIVRQRRLRAAYGPLQRAFLRRARRIVVATELDVAHSDVLPGFHEKCRVIPHGLDPAAFARTPEVERRARALRDEHGRFVLFVGRLVDYKGVDQLIAAAQRLGAGIQVLIVGEGPRRAALEEQARSLGLLGGRVRFRGRVAAGAELAAHYHACELFVLPSISRAEAFGLVQAEAMACGKPVVATRLDTGASLVQEDGVTGLYVRPGDPEALADAISGLLTDDLRRARMGQAALDRFRDRFTQERMVAAYRELYREIAS
jgi:rhamnosyl/mannosyltransferase